MFQPMFTPFNRISKPKMVQTPWQTPKVDFFTVPVCLLRATTELLVTSEEEMTTNDCEVDVLVNFWILSARDLPKTDLLSAIDPCILS